MIIYYSMMVWIGLMYFLTNPAKKKSINNDFGYTVPKIAAIVTFSYLIFWIGMRSGFIDTYAYINSFKDTVPSFSRIPQQWTADNKSAGYDTLQIVFKTLISNNYHVWLMFIAIVQGYCVASVIRRYSTNFYYSCFLFILSLNFTWMMNGIRQFIPAAVLFFLSDWIKDRKTVPFIVAVLLLSTVHFTALIMIPIYFFVTDKPFGKKILIFIALLLLAILFLNPFMNGVEDALQNTSYSGYKMKMEDDDGVNPIRVLVAFVPVAISFIYRKKIEEYDDSFVYIAVNMSIISAGLYLLGVFTSGILMGRLPIYFELYNLILLPFLFDYCFSKNNRKLIYSACTVGYFGFFYLLFRDAYYVSEFTGRIY